ncbi:hypothetical protein E4198_12915 [Streptomyces sp. RKND-216]|uniref:hypothetical protein n=1 Tax=Streptomyces sp. RKND-216 TaxID=2562581 RepID=UPI00109E0B38|nr:hypothetical protein [Streptomyces sp. RKND-216]THA25501.1 hypothetical protein E4198_12915 [Streptomyces sp. RKND-216]
MALLDAATFVLAAAAFALIRLPRRQPPAATSPPPDGTRPTGTATGARYLWGHPALRPLVLTLAAAAALSRTRHGPR